LKGALLVFHRHVYVHDERMDTIFQIHPDAHGE